MNECLITDYDINGRGITRIDNVVVFVDNALLDEIVSVKITKKNKNFYEGEVVEIMRKSDNRITVKCPYYFKCGGCDLMHMNLEEELKFKENKIKKTLEKSLKKEIKVNAIVSDDEILGYRNKVTFQVKNDIGFFEKNSNSFLPVDRCLLCDQAINELITELKKIDLSKVKSIVVRVSKYNRETMVIIDATEEIDASSINANSIYLRLNNKYVLKKGKEHILEKMDDFIFNISPSSFFQVNTNLAIKLYKKIKEYAKENMNVLDLYCGTGTIGIFLSDVVKHVYGIEINEEAIKDANLNKETNKISNIDFYAMNANKFLSKVKNVDLLIVDPPRGGLDKKTIDSVLKLKPKTIAYVSCNVATLSRDLKLLQEDYELIEVTPFNMFPRTCHLESVCILERR